MNKPVSIIIKETKAKLANICNESGLSPIILDLIVQGIYSEIHSIAEKHCFEEEKAVLAAQWESASGESYLLAANVTSAEQTAQIDGRQITIPAHSFVML